VKLHLKLILCLISTPKYTIVLPFFLLIIAKAQSSSSTSKIEPKLSVWLARWEKKRKYQQGNKGSEDGKETNIANEDDIQTFSLPANLPPLPQLPPSMLPPPLGGYPKLPKVAWG
jgi:hypothetical protein